MVKARKYVVKKYFEGVPKKSDFDIVEYELPPLKDGEILLKTEWVSVDPYLRSYNRKMPVPYDQFSYQVGIVEESKHPTYPVGTRVVTHNGWCDYSVVDVAKITAYTADSDSLEVLYKLPELKGLSPSLGIGAAGMPGIAAYYGFLEICQPKAGETVVVTGAAGAVGSVVGQIAKIKGCKVIGFAGSDDKVKWVEEELGFDKAFNYKTVDVQSVLKNAAPKGVDCYFDTVGGEISSLIITQMNKFGRVSVCGYISAYNEDHKKTPTAPILQPSILFKELKIEGFIVTRWASRWQGAIAQLITWINHGQLKPKEHVTVGFDRLYDAFVGMMAGENKGKAVVKI
ncbi:prostaglandin reductase 1-like [Melitaea cinxia]|uniref:prostaglandin reductase 1-like n=1 Tax=Melitaea cinxia TaxID=113334 RepID=UPI001E274984|nr:prostaglandin reductase 1-like [Melitaea cinxia]